ncbi:MAG: non-ribosomal peptide synthetase [Caldilineaceae bacterium]|nr:non-ribosomal peptide synthetase [Caldilineaceae bacterium]
MAWTMDQFERTVAAFPQRRAVSGQSAALTYAELNAAANAIADEILSNRPDGSEPIALMFNHDSPLLVAMLAVLKSGKFFSCLEPGYPSAQLEFMLEDLQTGLLLCDEANFKLATAIAADRCAVMAISLAAVASAPNIQRSVSDDDLFGVFYTSGSTGQPKGVMRIHQQLIDRIHKDTRLYRILPADCFSVITSASSGAAATDAMLALLNGASVAIYPTRQWGATRLADWLRAEAVTVLRPPVAFFRRFVDSLRPTDRFPHIRLITFTGEALLAKDIEAIRRIFELDCLVEHRLSTSETGLITRLLIDQHMPILWPTIPVGYAETGVEVLLLDESGQEVADDQDGEIVVRSQIPLPGYWRRPELTGSRFVPDAQQPGAILYRTGDLGWRDADGCLHHGGRKDQMVKIRGYRVEIAAIEDLLLHIPGVGEAAVVAHPVADGSKSLVAYLGTAQSAAPSIQEIRSRLAEKLPEFMIPTRFVFVASLPLLPNGKVDRRALPPPGNERPHLSTPHVAPRTLFEEKLAEIWAEVLGLDIIGVDDDFLELGGHSLAATQIVSRVQQTFDSALSMQSLFSAATVTEMASLLLDVLLDRTEQAEITDLLTEPGQL